MSVMSSNVDDDEEAVVYSMLPPLDHGNETPRRRAMSKTTSSLLVILCLCSLSLLFVTPWWQMQCAVVTYGHKFEAYRSSSVLLPTRNDKSLWCDFCVYLSNIIQKSMSFCPQDQFLSTLLYQNMGQGLEVTATLKRVPYYGHVVGDGQCWSGNCTEVLRASSWNQSLY